MPHMFFAPEFCCRTNHEEAFCGSPARKAVPSLTRSQSGSPKVFFLSAHLTSAAAKCGGPGAMAKPNPPTSDPSSVSDRSLSLDMRSQPKQVSHSAVGGR